MSEENEGVRGGVRGGGVEGLLPSDSLLSFCKLNLLYFTNLELDKYFLFYIIST